MEDVRGVCIAVAVAVGTLFLGYALGRADGPSPSKVAGTPKVHASQEVRTDDMKGFACSEGPYFGHCYVLEPDGKAYEVERVSR